MSLPRRTNLSFHRLNFCHSMSGTVQQNRYNLKQCKHRVPFVKLNTGNVTKLMLTFQSKKRQKMVFFESIVARFLYNINFNQKDFGSLNGWKERGNIPLGKCKKAECTTGHRQRKAIENLYGTPMEFSS